MITRYVAVVLIGVLAMANAQADDDRNHGQIVSDCNHEANARSLKGHNRQEFVDWCTATAQRFDNNVKDVGRYYGRYDSCADSARRLGYKGDERQRYMDWCVDRKPEQATASYWDSYRNCYARATERGHENEDRRDYIERCLEGGGRNVDSALWQTYQQCFETADDRKLGGDAREDFVNKCVGRGDQRAYDNAVTRSRTCANRARSLNLSGRELDRFMNWCSNPYQDKDDDYARRWERDRRCYATADDRNLTGEKRRDYIEQCMGYGRYSANESR